jgi:trigger factor
MKAVVEPLEGNKVKLSVEIDAAEFDRALDATFRRMSREVRVPGFRPGKVPRRVLEARLGPDAARQEALREALPEYYAQAVRDHDVDVIAPPDIEVTSDGTEGPLAFEAVVETRPVVGIPGYAGLQVTLPPLEVTEADVDAQVDRLRDTFAELKEVERPAIDGDHVTVNLQVSARGTRREDLDREDLLYEVGSERVVKGLDAAVRGAKTGDIVEFRSEEPAAPEDRGPEALDPSELEFRVLVKGVSEKILPEVSDAWAAEASEFSTVEELRADIRTRLEAVRKVQARLTLREASLEALVALVIEEMPEVMVSAEMQNRLHDLGHRLEAQGANLAQYLEAIGRDQDAFVAELRESALQAVKADLALRALADAESLEVSDEELDAEIEAVAERNQVDPDRLRRQLAGSEQLATLRSDLRKSRALSWLLDNVQAVDEEGRPVDRALLEDPSGEPPTESSSEGDMTETPSVTTTDLSEEDPALPAEVAP